MNDAEKTQRVAIRQTSLTPWSGSLTVKLNLCATEANAHHDKTSDGRRMGVWITWDESGKKWRYRIDGHLIEASGPIGKNAFVFGTAPEQNDG